MPQSIIFISFLMLFFGNFFILSDISFHTFVPTQKMEYFCTSILEFLIKKILRSWQAYLCMLQAYLCMLQALQKRFRLFNRAYFGFQRHSQGEFQGFQNPPLKPPFLLTPRHWPNSFWWFGTPPPPLPPFSKMLAKPPDLYRTLSLRLLEKNLNEYRL